MPRAIIEIAASGKRSVFHVEQRRALHNARVMPVQEREWENRVKRMLKAELTRQGVTYSQLVGLLADQGVMDSEPHIRNKISRGKFTAVFMLQCLNATGARVLRFD